MTRAEKIRKLANAIREYRGAYGSDSGVWIRYPKPDALLRVKNWLERLRIPVYPALEKIDAFGHTKEMQDWLATL